MLPGAAQNLFDLIVPFQHELNYIDLVTNVDAAEFTTVLLAKVVAIAPYQRTDSRSFGPYGAQATGQ
jgi:hypothetical protein